MNDAVCIQTTFKPLTPRRNSRLCICLWVRTTRYGVWNIFLSHLFTSTHFGIIKAVSLSSRSDLGLQNSRKLLMKVLAFPRARPIFFLNAQTTLLLYAHAVPHAQLAQARQAVKPWLLIRSHHLKRFAVLSAAENPLCPLLLCTPQSSM